MRDLRSAPDQDGSQVEREGEQVSEIKIYLAGPMRGIEEFNFPAFHSVERWLKRKGWTEIINPAKHDEENGFDPTGLTGNEDLSDLGFDLREALAWDLDQVARSTHLFLLNGWENSSGARAEYALAQALGLYIGSEESYDDAPGAGPCHAAKDFAAKWGLPHERVGAHASSGSGEVRITSSTGGQKGQKMAQVGSVDPLALLRVAEVAGFGAQKYERLNFMRGYDWDLSFDALQRHLLQFWNGEDRDEESGLLHVAHAAWHCLALIAFIERGLGTDTRYKGA